MYRLMMMMVMMLMTLNGNDNDNYNDEYDNINKVIQIPSIIIQIITVISINILILAI